MPTKLSSPTGIPSTAPSDNQDYCFMPSVQSCLVCTLRKFLSTCPWIQVNTYVVVTSVNKGTVFPQVSWKGVIWVDVTYWSWSKHNHCPRPPLELYFAKNEMGLLWPNLLLNRSGWPFLFYYLPSQFSTFLGHETWAVCLPLLLLHEV